MVLQIAQQRFLDTDDNQLYTYANDIHNNDILLFADDFMSAMEN